MDSKTQHLAKCNIYCTHYDYFLLLAINLCYDFVGLNWQTSMVLQYFLHTVNGEVTKYCHFFKPVDYMLPREICVCILNIELNIRNFKKIATN